MYSAVKTSNPNFGQLSLAEQAALQANIKTIFGDGDLSYLLANTVVLPSMLQAQAGATVATSGGPTSQVGAVTSSAAVVGTGTIS